MWAWRYQLPAFGARRRTIAFDNRGTGRSSLEPGPFSMEQFADDAVAVLDALGIESAHVLGMSMGDVRRAAHGAAGARAGAVTRARRRRTRAAPSTRRCPAETLEAWLENAQLPPPEFVRQTMHLSFSPGWSEAHPERYEELVAARLEHPTPPECWQAQFAAAGRFLQDGAPGRADRRAGAGRPRRRRPRRAASRTGNCSRGGSRVPSSSSSPAAATSSTSSRRKSSTRSSTRSSSASKLSSARGSAGSRHGASPRRARGGARACPSGTSPERICRASSSSSSREQRLLPGLELALCDPERVDRDERPEAEPLVGQRREDLALEELARRLDELGSGRAVVGHDLCDAKRDGRGGSEGSRTAPSWTRTSTRTRRRSAARGRRGSRAPHRPSRPRQGGGALGAAPAARGGRNRPRLPRLRAPERGDRPLRLGPARLQLPGAGRGQRRDPPPLRHRRAEGALARAARRRRHAVVLLDDRARVSRAPTRPACGRRPSSTATSG